MEWIFSTELLFTEFTFNFVKIKFRNEFKIKTAESVYSDVFAELGRSQACVCVCVCVTLLAGVRNNCITHTGEVKL